MRSAGRGRHVNMTQNGQSPWADLGLPAACSSLLHGLSVFRVRLGQKLAEVFVPGTRLERRVQKDTSHLVAITILTNPDPEKQ